MLTQLTTLKARMGIAPYETADDTLLNTFIKLVSGRFELECGRRFSREAESAFDFRADATEIAVDCYPVETVRSFFLKSTEAEGWLERPDVGFLISPSRATLWLEAPLGTHRQIGRVVFCGGYVLPGITPAPNQVALPDELEQAVVEQVAYLYANRNRIGILSVGGGSGAISILRDLNLLPSGSGDSSNTGNAWFKFAQVDLLPGVQAVLQKYRRLVLC